MKMCRTLAFSWLLSLLFVGDVQAQATSSAATQSIGNGNGDDNSNNANVRTRTRTRRRLNTDITDPKSVEMKEQQEQAQAQQADQTQTTKSELSVLALGGSVTWGSTLGDRLKAYPWVIGDMLVDFDEQLDVHVDNLAMRATGADFPSLCIESLIEEAGSADRSYDLILMDFVQNGTNGFPLLLKRLRTRFPEAVIVYVKLFSILANAMEESSGKFIPQLGGVQKVQNADPPIQWAWREGDVFNRGWNKGNEGCGREICDVQAMEALVKDASMGQGFVFDMTRPASPSKCIREEWFAPDWHHLSAKGHDILANDLLAFLRDSALLANIRAQPSHKPLGPWEGGDQCYNWFMSGQNPLKVTGANMKNMLKNPTNQKWVLEVDGDGAATTDGGATIEFDSKFDHEVPLGLGYMSRQEPPYPFVEVTINDSNNNNNNVVTIDPKLNGLPIPNIHVTAFYHIGMAKPGHNVIHIQPLPLTPPPEDPFRVVGVYLCGECAEMGDLGSGAMNHHADATELQ
jgi:lysophospholipase L1-like esterase